MVFKQTYVKTRNPHKCFSYYRLFDIGTTMRYTVGTYDVIYGTYSCTTCDKIMDLLPDDDGYPEGYVYEMLELNQTPEILLEKLNKILWKYQY